MAKRTDFHGYQLINPQRSITFYEPEIGYSWWSIRAILPSLRRINIFEYTNHPGRAYVEIFNKDYVAEYFWIDWRIDANEDAEYGHEWNLYGEAETQSVMQYNDFNVCHHDWLMTRCEPMLAFGTSRYYATYRRYPLIDAAQIEAL